MSSPGKYRAALAALVVARTGDILDIGAPVDRIKAMVDDKIGSYEPYSIEPRIALLEEGLDRAKAKGGEDFFDLFDALTQRGLVGSDYRRALASFVAARAGDIMDIGAPVARIKAMVEDKIGSYESYSIEPRIALLEAGLDRAKGSEDFFDLFDALAERGQGSDYRTALDGFAAARARDIMALAPSPGQIRRLERAIREPASAVKLLEAVLDGTEKTATAREFFAVFDALTMERNPSEAYANALADAAVANVKRIMRLGPSAAQLGRLALYVAIRPDVGVALLEETLERVRSAGDFEDILHVVVPAIDYSGRSRGAYKNFFIDNLDAILALPPGSEGGEEMLGLLGRFVEDSEIDRARVRKRRRRGTPGCAPATADLVSGNGGGSAP